MKIERTSLFNIFGITSKEKSYIYCALENYRKRFGESDIAHSELTHLMNTWMPTDEAEMMNRPAEKKAVTAAADPCKILLPDCECMQWARHDVRQGGHHPNCSNT